MAATQGIDDIYPTLITLEELHRGCFSESELRALKEKGGLKWTLILTIDAESVYKSTTSRDMRPPAEKTLLGHVWWLREMLRVGIIQSIQWCDTRDMTADGHTKGSIERAGLLAVMQGDQVYKHDLKRHTPHRQGGPAQQCSGPA